MKLARTLAVLALAFALLAAALASPLADYVAKDDGAFSWNLVSSTARPGYTLHVLNMTSQIYLNSTLVDRPLWQHWMLVAVPANVDASLNKAMLFIDGSTNRPTPPTSMRAPLDQFSVATGSVVAQLLTVPNQPLAFEDGVPRIEDGILAYGWNKFRDTKNPEWITRLAMVKSAVKAMNAVTQFAEQNLSLGISQYVVTGGSKRAWAAWLTAAVDPRVVSVIPISIEVLSIQEVFEHNFRVLGRWAPLLVDYVSQGIVDWIFTEDFEELAEIEDPVSYRDSLRLPKFLMAATGDQFTAPDSWQFGVPLLKGETVLRFVPNAGHGTPDPLALLAYYNAVIRNIPRPEYDWRVTRKGTGQNEVLSITVDAERFTLPGSNQRLKPTAKLWTATNPIARDFRIVDVDVPQGPIWSAVPVQNSKLGNSGKSRFTVEVPAPASGFTALMVELTYPTASGVIPNLVFTTGVYVVPDIYPFPSPAVSQ